MKAPIESITIGKANKDEELLKRIWKYKEEHNIKTAADTVRILCEDALNMKTALRR